MTGAGTSEPVEPKCLKKDVLSCAVISDRFKLSSFSSRSQEGSQFVKGFGGIGGMLRYKVDFQALQCDDLDEEEYDLDDY